MDVLRVAAALALLGWLPGYAWSRALQPGADLATRAAYSIVLSVALMALALFLGNILLDVPIAPVVTIAESLLIAGAGFGLEALLRRRRRLREGENRTP